jgi:hypothetical protein
MIYENIGESRPGGVSQVISFLSIFWPDLHDLGDSEKSNENVTMDTTLENVAGKCSGSAVSVSL